MRMGNMLHFTGMFFVFRLSQNMLKPQARNLVISFNDFDWITGPSFLFMFFSQSSSLAGILGRFSFSFFGPLTQKSTSKYTQTAGSFNGPLKGCDM